MKISYFIEKHYLIIIIIIISFILANYITKFLTSLNNKKRIKDYSLNINNDKEYTSFLDKLLIGINFLIDNFAIFLSRFKIVKNYGLRYQKYKYQNKDNIYYISIKILTSIIFLIIYFIFILTSKYEIILVLIPLIILIGFYLPDLIFLYNYNKYISIIKNNFLEAVIMLNNLFKSGLTIIEAITSLKNNLNGPLQKEFDNIAIDLSYGITITESFNRFYERVGIEDIKYLANTLKVINMTGGDITKTFDSILIALKDKQNLELEIKKITAKSRALIKILIIIPLICFLTISLINKEYFKIIFTTPEGILILGIIIAFYILYAFSIRKILKVE